MSVRFVDLVAQNQEIHQSVESELAHLHRDASYVGGPQLAAVDAEVASYLGVKRVVGDGSGTDALRLALLALGIGAGDEVITSAMTFIATAAAIFQTGARPVFVEVDRENGNMSARALRHYLENRRWSAPYGPRAILPVHLYGMPAPIHELQSIADEFDLKMVEDACQAHGARINTPGGWVMMGTIGAAGCFSFYPGKNLGAWGDGGAIATNDEELAARATLLRDHGRISHYAHEEFGYNSRLDAIQAIVLRAKLSRLDDWNMRRRDIADAYRNLLADCDVELPFEPERAESCYHLFVIRSKKRDLIRKALLQNRIECGIHYPVPLHLQPACNMLGYRPGDLPVSEHMADTVLSLPLHPHLTPRDIGRTAATVRMALESRPETFDRELKESRKSAWAPPVRT